MLKNCVTIFVALAGVFVTVLAEDEALEETQEVALQKRQIVTLTVASLTALAIEIIAPIIILGLGIIAPIMIGGFLILPALAIILSIPLLSLAPVIFLKMKKLILLPMLLMTIPLVLPLALPALTAPILPYFVYLLYKDGGDVKKAALATNIDTMLKQYLITLVLLGIFTTALAHEEEEDERALVKRSAVQEGAKFLTFLTLPVLLPFFRIVGPPYYLYLLYQDKGKAYKAWKSLKKKCKKLVKKIYRKIKKMLKKLV